MLGEVTPQMAEAIASSPKLKLFLPLSQENIEIVGIDKEPLPKLVEEAVARVKEAMKNVRGPIAYLVDEGQEHFI